MNTSFVLAGHLITTPEPKAFSVLENGYLVIENGLIQGCYSSLPEKYAALPLQRYDHQLIIPGLCDIHVHAPQYAYRGLGMDLELLEWLNTHAFPEEAHYEQMEYAQKAYGQFVHDLQNSATTRASIFATLHVPATLLLTQLLEQAGMRGYVGKVNMDRNSPDNLRERDAKESLRQTEEWLTQTASFRRVRPILTPRFVPSCSDELLEGLAALRKRDHLPLQSHLSENENEIAWVKELCPAASCYADAYALRGLLEEDGSVVMAHCVHPTDGERKILKEKKVLVAHCPASNTNLCSGIAPIRRFLEEGISVGLGSDIAGGYELSMFRAMTDAVQVSKLRSCFDPLKPKPLSLSEAFYLATKGGGQLFGQVGSFEKGYQADIVVLDDSRIESARPLKVEERLERAIYLEKDVRITAKYIAGEPVKLSTPNQ
ncbi:MAG: amidohydrolase family protein [Eubacteriales bacterium]|nr:amidohydrolase family protein [Eubacteriales bacterium]